VDEEILLLARALPRERYSLAVFPTARGFNGPEPTLEALRDLGVHVDTAPFDLSFEDTIIHLVRRLSCCDVAVSFQDVADLYPALDRMAFHPPVIERGLSVREALSGPKHATTRYVAATREVRDAAASLMPDRPQHAVVIPHPERAVAQPGNEVALWKGLFAQVQAEVTPALGPELFQTFLQGGWECSTHVRHDGRRLDLIAATGHDTHAEADYRQLGDLGLATMRDGLRWHLIETTPGHYDFASWTPMLEAAQRSGTQVIWDLLHYGWPSGLDIWRPDFVERFVAFARAAALHRREVTDEVPFWCPVNEMSFQSWAGGDAAYLNPHARGRGFELKCQLARASIAAMEALRDVDPRTRFVHCEPMIAVHHDPATGRPSWEAEGYHNAQFQAFDLVSGRLWPILGGQEKFLDVVGVNYYWNNQWVHAGPVIDMDHPRYSPLSDLLVAVYARYKRPVLIAETGTEGERRASWFRYVSSEVARARARGVPVEGICLYPIANHPGWDDDRDCPNGLLSAHPGPRGRVVHEPLAQEIQTFQKTLAGAEGTRRRA
jgi:hypothetical protein